LNETTKMMNRKMTRQAFKEEGTRKRKMGMAVRVRMMPARRKRCRAWRALRGGSAMGDVGGAGAESMASKSAALMTGGGDSRVSTSGLGELIAWGC
jgi:hypothetical protein